MTKEFTEPVLFLDNDGVHIDSNDITESLAKKNISPSMVTAVVNGCSARWIAEQFVIRDLIPEAPDNAARRGSMFHKIMELFFELPNDQRDKDALKKITNHVLNSDEFSDMTKYPEAMTWLKSAIQNYYGMKANPKNVHIASLKDSKGNEKPGLEYFVKGRIGDTSRDILGFIDIVAKAPHRDDILIVRDWKTGAKVKRWNPKTKSTDGLGEARQQVIYTMLLEQKGYKVGGAQLIYPMAQEVVSVDVKDKDFRAQVVSDVEACEDKLDHMSNRNTFEYKPEFLCSWCPLAKVCPKADLKKFEKAVDAYQSQPDMEILGTAIDVLQ